MLYRSVVFSLAFNTFFFFKTIWHFVFYCGIFGTSLIAQLVKNHLQCRRLQFDSWIRKIHWRMDRLPTPVFSGFLCSSVGKESTCSVGDLGLIPWLRRAPGEGKGHPLHYSGLENTMDNSPWGCKELDTTEWLSLLFFTVQV